MLDIGDVVKLKFECLGNEPGTLGVVYDVYEFEGHRETWRGVSVIFQNGEYDGFGEDEQEMFLEYIYTHENFNYTFKNVMKLSQDFDKGVFEPVLGTKKGEEYKRQFPDWRTECS